MKKINFTQTQKKGYEFLNLNTLIQRKNYINAVVDFEINKIDKAISELENLTGIKRNVWLTPSVEGSRGYERRSHWNSELYYDVNKVYKEPDMWGGFRNPYTYRDGDNNEITEDEYYTQMKNYNIFSDGISAIIKYQKIDNIIPPYQKQTLRDEWTNEANETFERRLIHMLSKLDQFGFISDNVNLSKDDIVSSVQNNLEFYISATDNSGNYLGRVHARLIWVECYEKASHYRFITTLKK